MVAVSPAITTPPPSPPRARGWHALPVATPDPTLGVTFDLGTCFWDPPPAGMLPLRLDVRNDGDREREWTLAFSATSGYYRYGSTYTTSYTVRVPAGAERRF